MFGFSIEIHIRIHFHFLFFSKCWKVGPLHWPVGLLQLRFPLWLKAVVTPLLYNLIFLNNFLLDYTKNAHNERGFSNVIYATASLPRQMLTTKLSTMHFARIGSDNRKLCVVGRL